MNTAFWFCAIVTAVSALTSLGFSAATLRSNGDTYISALYAAVRSLALAVISSIPLFSHSQPWLLAEATAMTITQTLDGYVGIKQHDTMKTFGPLCLAVLNLCSLIIVARS